MKLKKRRSSEVPPKIRSFTDNVTSAPLENIEEPLKHFVWEFDKGDFHHWVDLFNHFDSYFEKYIKSRKDLQFEDSFLAADPPFPREAVLQILRVIRIILENCTNKHFYSSYEQHLSALLSSTDADVVEASLQTLAAFLKKTIGKCSIRDASLSAKLFAFTQGWGGKEEGLGLIACCLNNGCDSAAYKLGCTLHFEFYSFNDSSTEPTSAEAQGLQVIHVPDISTRQESNLELLNSIVAEYRVPPKCRFALLTRLRFARAFASLASRQQYTCIRLYSFIVLVQASNDADDLAAFFNNEPEFVSELVLLLSYGDDIPEKIRVLAVLSLVALCHDRSHQLAVLTAVTSGGNRGFLPSLMQKTVDSVTSHSSKWSVLFAEALISLVTLLVSTSSGVSVLLEVGFIPTLLPLLKDTEPQHLHLVSTAVNVYEACMDYNNPVPALFRDLGGLDDTVERLKVEVSFVEKGFNSNSEDSQISRKGKEIALSSSDELDNLLPHYSEALVSYHRRLLMKTLLRIISSTMDGPATARIYGSEGSLLPACLCIIIRRAKDFGGGVFSLAVTVMSELIHKDPTCFPVLDAANLPSAFLDAIMGGVLCSAEAITCIPQCLGALCLNNKGLQAVLDRNALGCFVRIFTSRTYIRALSGDTPGSVSAGLEELMRHASSLRGACADVLIEILTTISNIGSEAQISSSSNDSMSCAPVPMETDAEENLLSSSDYVESCKLGCSEQKAEPSSDGSLMNVESFLPDCVNNAARLLETILQNADTCRIFIEKKGIEAFLKLFTLPLMPLTASLGQMLSAAFKSVSTQHSVAPARAVCSYLREHLKVTNELLVVVTGTRFADLDASKQIEVFRCLSSLEGLLSLASLMLRGTTMLSELGSADPDLFKDLGRVYKEVVWQISVSSDSRISEKQDRQEAGISDAALFSFAGRESDDDANLVQIVRYRNPSARSGSQSLWRRDQEFIPLVRSGESLQRHTRHGITRIRGGRSGRHTESRTSHMDTEGSANSSESSSVHDAKRKSPDVIVLENLDKLVVSVCSFFVSIIKGLTPSHRRRSDSGLTSSASKSLLTALAKIFHDALSFSGHSTSAGLEMSVSVKCRYFGKVVDDMLALIYDRKKTSVNTILVNNFYVHGTFKEILTTFEATSQLLWTLPYSVPASGSDHEKAAEANKLSQCSWLLDTLRSYCLMLECFVNSSLLLSPNSPSQIQLLVQPVADGLSIGLFPVPRDPEVFVRMLQSQVLDAILPVWNHPMFPICCPAFITMMVSLVTHIYSGVGDVKRSHIGNMGNTARFMAPAPDEATIATIMEMGFTRARAEEALRRVETNSVEMAMEWLFSHSEDPVQEDDDLARALALSLGNSSETSKDGDSTDKLRDMRKEERGAEAPPVDDILASSMKLFQSSESLAFSLTDLLVTLCNRNKGKDRPGVVSYLIQQLKLCPLDFSVDTSKLCMISHILALLLSEDVTTREIAAENGIIGVAINILTSFRLRNESGQEVKVPKCISTLLLILDNMLHSKPKVSAEGSDGINAGVVSDSLERKASLSIPVAPTGKNSASDDETELVSAFENILGKPSGYLTLEECHSVLAVACEFIKQQAPAPVMQAVLQLCAHLTKIHVIAMRFLENGCLASLFNLPKSCFFPGYDSVASAIIRHLLEDPQTLQKAMESEIRQTLSSMLSRQGGRLSPRSFLTSMAPVISRDPVIFMRAAAAVCQLETSGGRLNVMLLKEKEKEKDKTKTSGVEIGVSSSECVRMSETKLNDGQVKMSKGHKKVPINLTQVIDQLVEIVMNYPAPKKQEDCANYSTPMEVDEPLNKEKGKSKVDDSEKMVYDILSQSSAGLARVTFVLKLMSDILLMYVHAAGVILRRDLEICQGRVLNQIDGFGHGGLLNHVLHWIFPTSSNKATEVVDEWREKLSEKASWFLVVLSGRSSEGRRRVISEIVKALSSFSILESGSSSSLLQPNKKLLAFVDLINSILSKNSSSSNLPGPGCSPDIAKTMIDGGMVQSLTNILQVIDLDHPDASKVVNHILKALESLTRAANASDQIFKSDGPGKRKLTGANARTEEQSTAFSSDEIVDNVPNLSNQHGTTDATQTREQLQGASHEETNFDVDRGQAMGSLMRIEMGGTIASNLHMEHEVEFMHEDMDAGAALHNTDGVEMSFRVDHRADEEDDEDVGDDGEDDEDDEDTAEEEAALMSLPDTDVDDHDDNGLVDEYNDDEMIDDEDDDFHENNVIEVRWREGLDDLDHLQVLGRPGAENGLFDGAAEPFHGVDVDDIFGLRRPLGAERRRQTSRTFHERSVVEGSGFHHPLLLRPAQSGRNSSRDLEALSAGSFDGAHIYMFDAPILSSQHAPTSLFGDRLVGAAAPPLIDFSFGMDPLHLAGRRGAGDGRWTDDGQPQAGGQASAIAQAVEEQFISQLRSLASASNPTSQRRLENLKPQEQQHSDLAASAMEDQPHVVSTDLGNQQSGEQNQEFCTDVAQYQENSTVDAPALSHVQTNFEPVAEEACGGLGMQENISGVPAVLHSLPDGDEGLEIMEGNITVVELQSVPEFATPSTERHVSGEQSHSEDFVELSRTRVRSSNHAPEELGSGLADAGLGTSSTAASADVDMDCVPLEGNQSENLAPISDNAPDDPVIGQNSLPSISHGASSANTIDPTFLEALPEDLRAEVLASQQSQTVQSAAYVPPPAEDIDPEFLAALPPDIQAEVLAQQRAQRLLQSHQDEGRPVEMDNASIIATFPADLREEVLLTSSEAVLSALPSPLLAEAQMLRDRAMSHYQAHSLFGGSHRLSGRRNILGFDRQTVIDRGVGVTIGRRAVSAITDSLKVKELEGAPLLDADALKSLIRLLRLVQPLGKGLLQRLLLNLCAHTSTRAVLLHIMLDMVKPDAQGSSCGSVTVTSQRLYGCQRNVVYGRSHLSDGLPPLVLRRVIENLTYLATNHSGVADILFYFDPSLIPLPRSLSPSEKNEGKGKEKVQEGTATPEKGNIPLVLFLELLNQPLFLRSNAHLEQVMGLLQIVVYTAASKLECQLLSKKAAADSETVAVNAASGDKKDLPVSEPTGPDSSQEMDKNVSTEVSTLDGSRTINLYNIFLQLPQSGLRNLCSLLAHEGLSDKVYLLAANILKKLAFVAAPHRKFFTSELAGLAHGLTSSAVGELITLRTTHKLGLYSGSRAGAAALRVLQALTTLTSPILDVEKGAEIDGEHEEQTIIWKLNMALEPMWLELSDCISTTEANLGQASSSSPVLVTNAGDHVGGASSLSPPLPPGTQRLLPYIEAFFVLCEKLQASHSVLQHDFVNVTAREIKESSESSITSSTNDGGVAQRRPDGVTTFARFTEKHRRLLNAFIRQTPGLLEKSLSMMLKAPRLIDFDNKRVYFRSRIRQQHEHHPSAPLRISVRRAYILEDSYNQLRMRPTQDLKGRLTVQFQGEEGIDAGGLTREWYQLLSRVIFDKGALLFTTVGNNATFQPNPNSVYQTEHLSYFKFVGRVVAKALFDGQLLDVYFTRSFYKHILGVKVTYHDIEAVDPDYYKNLKWMLENDVSDIPDMTFSMDADEEKHILYEKTEVKERPIFSFKVTDYELKPGGRNIRVTEETKHEYVDLVAEHILTNAIRPQINSFLDGFNELVPRELISIFNDKELELLISGLPEIDLDDLKTNTEYTGYSAASSVVQWFWEVVKAFSKEDMARFLQFVTGTSKVPLEGFKALQGISGPQRFQIHKAYGAPERLPSAHTCFNQLDLPEYSSKEQLQERLLLAIHEASEGFGFG